MRFKNNYKDKIYENVIKEGLTYYIDTMGCAMNENDSNKYAGILESFGIKKADSIEEANFIMFNTCTVRENAENTLYGHLGSIKNYKTKKNRKFIIVAGCMAQQEKVVEKIKNSYPFTDVVFGTNSIQTFPEKIYNLLTKNEKSYEYVEEDNIVEDTPIVYNDKFKASVSIIYGCNNFCTYCIVPYVRGRERSREKVNILEDISNLAKKGYKEITLLGQNVNSYGNDLGSKENFPGLLREIEKIEGIEIIKFMSPHPKDFSDELIEVISKSNKISKQIHLPIQSGSNNILKAMNRKYNKEYYLELVEKMKDSIKNVSFSTDIIVGFPGETEIDFEDTLNIVKKVSFDQIFMYIYSKRSGTIAANLLDNTSQKEKSLRIQRLKKLFEEITFETNQKMLNQKFKVLVEGKSKTDENYFTGRTENNKIVNFIGEDIDIGKIIELEIVENHLWYLTGNKIEKRRV